MDQALIFLFVGGIMAIAFVIAAFVHDDSRL